MATRINNKIISNEFKNDILFDWDNVSTGVSYNLANGKKFSNYKLIEFSAQKTSAIKSYVSLKGTGTKTIQLTWYENVASGKTELLVELEYVSDTQFKCNRAAYSGDGGSWGDNPYPIVIRGII